MEELYQIIAMYAPTVLTVVGTILSYVKIFTGLKSNAKDIMNAPEMTALKTELKKTKEQLAITQTQLSEMVRRQGELINELSKVTKYEDKQNN